MLCCELSFIGGGRVSVLVCFTLNLFLPYYSVVAGINNTGIPSKFLAAFFEEQDMNHLV
jgi:hypothetical protein